MSNPEIKSWTESKKVNPLTLSNEEKTWTLIVERHNPTKKWVIILLSGFEDWRWNEYSEKRRWKKISLKKGTLFPLQTHTWGKFVAKRSRASIVGIKILPLEIIILGLKRAHHSNHGSPFSFLFLNFVCLDGNRSIPLTNITIQRTTLLLRG